MKYLQHRYEYTVFYLCPAEKRQFLCGDLWCSIEVHMYVRTYVYVYIVWCVHAPSYCHLFAQPKNLSCLPACLPAGFIRCLRDRDRLLSFSPLSLSLSLSLAWPRSRFALPASLCLFSFPHLPTNVPSLRRLFQSKGSRISSFRSVPSIPSAMKTKSGWMDGRTDGQLRRPIDQKKWRSSWRRRRRSMQFAMLDGREERSRSLLRIVHNYFLISLVMLHFFRLFYFVGSYIGVSRSGRACCIDSPCN